MLLALFSEQFNRMPVDYLTIKSVKQAHVKRTEMRIE